MLDHLIVGPVVVTVEKIDQKGNVSFSYHTLTPLPLVAKGQVYNLKKMQNYNFLGFYHYPANYFLGFCPFLAIYLFG
jgi:hypothetical protein